MFGVLKLELLNIKIFFRLMKLRNRKFSIFLYTLRGGNIPTEPSDNNVPKCFFQQGLIRDNKGIHLSHWIPPNYGKHETLWYLHSLFLFVFVKLKWNLSYHSACAWILTCKCILYRNTSTISIYRVVCWIPSFVEEMTARESQGNCYLVQYWNEMCP